MTPFYRVELVRDGVAEKVEAFAGEAAAWAFAGAAEAADPGVTAMVFEVRRVARDWWEGMAA